MIHDSMTNILLIEDDATFAGGHVGRISVASTKQETILTLRLVSTAGGISGS